MLPTYYMAEANAVLFGDLLSLLLAHLTRLDAAKLAVTCTAAAAACKASTALTSPAPRVMVCCSQTQRVLEVCLTPSGEPYVQHQLPGSAQAAATGRRQSQAACQPGLLPPCHVHSLKRGPQEWVTGTAFSPYDHALYVAAYGAKDLPSAILRFSPGTLRPTGILISDPAILNPEGVAFAKGCCYVASAGHATIVAVSVQGRRNGSIHQTLQLADDACPWGMTAWDPSTYPLHAAAAAHAATAHGKLGAGQQQQQQQQALSAPEVTSNLASRVSDHQTGTQAPIAVIGRIAATPADATEAEFHTQAARGCLFVTVQSDVPKDKWWLPPKGPASGALVCVPLSSDGHMLPWREWSKVKIKRPSGVTIDHAGHVWTTSLERLLLRFAGPCYPNSGCLLQRVNLNQLLPRGCKRLYPMDVQAAVRIHADQLATEAQSSRRGTLVHTSTLLFLTAHSGPRSRGVLAVLAVREGDTECPRDLFACWQDDKLLKQPNMLALQ